LLQLLSLEESTVNYSIFLTDTKVTVKDVFRKNGADIVTVTHVSQVGIYMYVGFPNPITSGR
jgi:hypothetical protein